MKRRIATALAAGALAVSSFGIAPVQAASPTPDPAVEAVCPAATPGTAECLALKRIDTPARPALAASSSSPLSGFYPADIQSAYALPVSQGSGLTVAVVDAYDLPTAEADLAVYRSQFGLPECTTANGCFRKVNQNGAAGAYPSADAGWGQEIALDMDMVSAACPLCQIILVESNSGNFSDLGTAVNTAVSMGAIAVSNSYGGEESSSNSYLDAHYYNHPGVAIVASTGDCGYACAGSYQVVQYPAASPYVVAVGGTKLIRDSSARGWTESAWGHSHGGAGSGCSLYSAKPSWQADTGCTNRTEADISAVADPNTGVAVYVAGDWRPYGGTSAASPIIAGAFALAGGPAAGTYPASYLYSHTTAINDVVGGDNVEATSPPCAVTYLCNGVAGYDGPTGLGTPNGVAAFTAPPSTYHALNPVRILDTRDGTGGPGGALGSHSVRTFQVTGAGGVPANATAVAGNLTVTQQTGPGFLYIGPTPTADPASSTLNFPVNDDRANAVTVALGGTGSLSVTYVAPSSGPTAHVIFDVTGYFTPDSTGATYHALTPTRVLDSRNGGSAGRLSSHVARPVQIAGAAGGVPTGATAITGNLTVTQQTGPGYLFIGPNSTNNPTSSTLNFPVGDDRANAVTVALDSGGFTYITFVASAGAQATHVILDVTGYFTQDATGSKYIPLTPTRILDSRSGTGIPGRLSSHAAQSFAVVGRAGVPATATGVTGNLTVTQQTSLGYLFVGPSPVNNPTSSTLNFPVGDDRANAVTVAVSGGSLGVTFVAPTGGQSTHVIFDVTGYFAP